MTLVYRRGRLPPPPGSPHCSLPASFAEQLTLPCSAPLMPELPPGGTILKARDFGPRGPCAISMCLQLRSKTQPRYRESLASPGAAHAAAGRSTPVSAQRTVGRYQEQSRTGREGHGPGGPAPSPGRVRARRWALGARCVHGRLPGSAVGAGDTPEVWRSIPDLPPQGVLCSPAGHT